MNVVIQNVTAAGKNRPQWQLSFQRYLLPFLSGLLLFAAWPLSPFTFIIFFAFIPLLWLEKTTKNNWLFFWILYFNFFIWNAATTWWIWNASPGGAVGAILANSLLMTIPWMLFRFTKKVSGNWMGYVSLTVYWLTFEYIHHNWDLSWPWLTLGNVFATSPHWIQWYQYTGTTGGSLWILVVNILIFTNTPGLQSNPHRNIRFGILQVRRVRWLLYLVFLLVPLFISALISMNGKKEGVSLEITDNVVVVQPNIDPYNEKFSGNTTQQIEKLIRQSESRIDTNTHLVVWPETAIAASVWEDGLLNNPYYQPVMQFVQRHPQILLVTGADSYQSFGNTKREGMSIRHDESTDTYYETYNTAVGLDARLHPQLYHKSKLVPGPESLPSWLSFMGPIFESLGGLSGTLGKSDSAVVFRSTGNPFQPAPVICYESIYGDYLTEYMRRGANIITIITNDGWWGNTPGYKQHMAYARLRAIETGCWIARSANTGISCFIDPAGNVLEPQPWDTEAAIKMDIPATTSTTFFTRHGDYISRIAWVVAMVLLIITSVKWSGKRIRK